MADQPGARDVELVSLSVQLATRAVQAGGGPFGAVVVRGGAVIAEGLNEAETLQDATAHAEVQAIRAACRALGSRWLSGCTLYCSAEPCPMCLAACYWADIERIVYAVSSERAAALGLGDTRVYEEIALDKSRRSIRMVELPIAGDDAPFRVRHENRSGLRG